MPPTPIQRRSEAGGSRGATATASAMHSPTGNCPLLSSITAGSCLLTIFWCGKQEAHTLIHIPPRDGGGSSVAAGGRPRLLVPLRPKRVREDSEVADCGISLCGHYTRGVGGGSLELFAYSKRRAKLLSENSQHGNTFKGGKEGGKGGGRFSDLHAL